MKDLNKLYTVLPDSVFPNIDDCISARFKDKLQ